MIGRFIGKALMQVTIMKGTISTERKSLAQISNVRIMFEWIIKVYSKHDWKGTVAICM